MPPPPPAPEDATLLLSAAAGGDKDAADRLLPLIYEQLRKSAQLGLAGERAGHTLSATVLVHEAYLRLLGPRDVPWANRGHFYAAAAEAMRRILIDHARTRARRGGEKRRLADIGDVADLALADPDQILAVDEAIGRLESEDAEAAALVRLRFFAGLSVDQAAEALQISPRTAARLWNFARCAVPNAHRRLVRWIMPENTRRRVREVFMEISELTPAERAIALERACGGDAAVRSEVEALLRAQDKDVGFMSAPTAGDARFSSEGSAADSQLQEAPGTVIGRYKLLQQIGEGGFGAVLLAEQREPVVRKVALKIIKLGMDTRQVIARFEVERQALAMMDHPNIAKVLDVGATETGRPYFVMDIVNGDPIAQYCDKHNLSIETRLELFTQVCQAVQHAHTKGIIHRDIKPSNILVSTMDGRPNAKVIDFGIAKATASKLTEKTLFTEHRQLIGTPEYMSPEQAEGSMDIDTRTDVYALGVLLYELLTGSTPFEAKTLRAAAYAEIQRIIREVEPPKPSTRLSQSSDTLASVAAHRHTEPQKLGTVIRGDLDWIVMKALEKDRQRRYETASGLAMDVRRYLQGEPVNAAPPSRRYRARKFLRRNRGAVAAASVIVGALVVSLAGLGVGQVRAQRARKAESIQLKAAEASAADAAIKAARAIRLSDFLRSMFSTLNPRRPIGREVSLRTILDGASESLTAGRLRDEPEIEADVRMILGDAYYMWLNDYYCAEREFADAAETREQVLGVLDPQTLDAMHSVGTALHYQGRYAEADAMARRTLEGRTQALGEEHPDTIASMEKLSRALSAVRRFEEAEPLRVRALELRRKVQGDDHPNTITSIAYLGNLYLEQDRLAEAEVQYREMLDRARRVYGAQSTAVASLARSLIQCLGEQEKSDEAAELCKESLLIQRAAFGDRHRTVAETLSTLGAVYVKAGKPDEAELVFAESLDIRREVTPGEDSVAWALFDLGRLRASQNRLAEAEVLMREGLEIRRTLAAAHGKTGSPWSLRELAGVLGAQGRQKEANALIREAVAIESKPASVLPKKSP